MPRRKRTVEGAPKGRMKRCRSFFFCVCGHDVMRHEVVGKCVCTARGCDCEGFKADGWVERR